MIGTFVTFRYADDFDESRLQAIATSARSRFAGMPGLRSKAFTIDPARRRATNLYVWDAEDAARAFFSEALLERVAGLYGAVPDVDFVRIAALVENR